MVLVDFYLDVASPAELLAAVADRHPLAARFCVQRLYAMSRGGGRGAAD